MSTRYKVVAPYITVKTREATAAILPGSHGIGIQGLSRRAILPEDVDEETIGHLLRSKLIEPVEDDPA